MKTRTELKQKAQEELLSAAQIAFGRIHDGYDQDLTVEQRQDLELEMSRQMARIENLFGYEKYSWARTC